MTSCQTCAYYDDGNEWCTHPDINMLVTGGYFQACLNYKEIEKCTHEWHADQDYYCNFCVKCGARQEIYTE